MGKFREYASYILTGLIHIAAGVIVYLLTSNILLSVSAIFLVMVTVDVAMVEFKDVISDIFHEFRNTKKITSKSSKKRYIQCKKNFEIFKDVIKPLTNYTTASIITICEKALNFIKVNNESEKVDNLENVFLNDIPTLVTAIKKYLNINDSAYEEEFNKLLVDFNEYLSKEYDNSVSILKNNFSSYINKLQTSISNKNSSEDN